MGFGFDRGKPVIPTKVFKFGENVVTRISLFHRAFQFTIFNGPGVA
jgi:hypothetical protein